jgi:hypothetical protein
MCACDFNYVCAEHRNTPMDWRLDQDWYRDDREDDISSSYAALSAPLTAQESRDAE